MQVRDCLCVKLDKPLTNQLKKTYTQIIKNKNTTSSHIRKLLKAILESQANDTRDTYRYLGMMRGGAVIFECNKLAGHTNEHYANIVYRWVNYESIQRVYDIIQISFITLIAEVINIYKLGIEHNINISNFIKYDINDKKFQMKYDKLLIKNGIKYKINCKASIPLQDISSNIAINSFIKLNVEIHKYFIP